LLTLFISYVLKNKIKSLAAFYYFKFLHNDNIEGLILYIALAQWVWSIKNVLWGPLTLDAGVFSWLVLAYARWTNNTFLSFVASAVHCIVFSGVYLVIAASKPWGTDYAQAAKIMRTSKAWVKIFFVWAFGQAIFWGITSREFYMEWKYSK
jgi:hypothetical protein